MHDGQDLIFRNRRRFNTVACGRRFGKTVMAEALLIESAIMGKPAAYFAPTYKMLSDVWKALKTTLNPIITGVSEQEKRLTIETGGISLATSTCSICILVFCIRFTFSFSY